MEEQKSNKVLKFLKQGEVIISLITVVLLVSLFIFRFYYVEYNTEPKIELNGESIIYLKANQTFNDPGVKATLNSKDISDKVKVIGDVDSSKVKNYTITYEVTNNKGKKKKTVKRKVVILDSISPEIKLKGKKKMTSSLNEEFMDPGYSATDNVDGNLTDKVKVYNKVNINKPGGYEILYEVTDSSNNKAYATRVVTVADYTAPVLKLKGGTVKIKTNGEYNEPGYTATDDIDGDLTNEVRVKGKVKPSKPAIYKLTYTVSDEAGNRAIKTRNVYVGTAKERAKYNSIKVSISSQMLYYYKNGELFMKTSVVTGQRGSHDTPRGTYRILYKAMHVTLKGRDYASPVTYWMPINGSGVGLHDATWRSRFGGSIYLTNGSHGCVNLPYSAAQKLYNNAPVGTIVYIY